MGCWSEQELVGEQGHWQAKKLTTDASEWEVWLDGENVGVVKWGLVGEHNMHNGLAMADCCRAPCWRRACGCSQCAGLVHQRPSSS